MSARHDEMFIIVYPLIHHQRHDKTLWTPQHSPFAPFVNRTFTVTIVIPLLQPFLLFCWLIETDLRKENFWFGLYFDLGLISSCVVVFSLVGTERHSKSPDDDDEEIEAGKKIKKQSKSSCAICQFFVPNLFLLSAKDFLSKSRKESFVLISGRSGAKWKCKRNTSGHLLRSAISQERCSISLPHCVTSSDAKKNERHPVHVPEGAQGVRQAMSVLWQEVPHGVHSAQSWWI